MAAIEFLYGAKWFFVGLHPTERFRLVADFDRLADDHVRGTAHRLAGTRNVYRARCGGRTVLYHERQGRITILIIR